MWRFVLTFSVLFISENSANKLDVSIYYETLCPDSVNFFKNQLDQTYGTLKQKMKVDLIPFGKASATKENEKWNFTCQHGAAECYGNKAHACAIDLAPESNSTSFVICAMISDDASKDENLKQANKLDVSIYYETLCPDSVNFFKNQLDQTYGTLKQKMKVDLIPFGKASATKENEKWNFTCQHGAAECYGNKAHACAIDLAPESNSTSFVICAMISDDASKDENLKQCATDHQISWNEIQKCMKSGKGDELLVVNGNRTAAVQPKIRFIPTIIFDNVFDNSLQNIALNNFEDVVDFLVDGGGACARCKSKNGGHKLYPTSILVVLFLLCAIKVL